MSRSVQLTYVPLWKRRSWLEALSCLAVATGTGLLLVQILLRPAERDLRDLAVYLVLSGAATMAAGWFALRLADRAVGLKIQGKVFLASLISSGVGLLNVFIIAKLMFLSNRHDLRLLVVLLVFSGVLTALFGLWIAITTAGRIGVAVTGIRALAAGEYSTRVSIPGGCEVAELGEHLNELALRLQAAETQRLSLERERRDLTAGISHDLRTPLSSIRAMAEALDDQIVEDPAEIRRYYATMRREIERLSRMIDDLFELAQMDAGALRLNRRPVALQEIAAEVVDAMQARASRLGVALALQVDDGLPEVLLDGLRLERALANLVRNALEHTASGGRIDVEIAGSEDWIEARVSDTGEGIEAIDLPHIWDRFYRAEPSRARGPRADDGAGLGLAIVRAIVEAHGGSVRVRSSPGEGATFILRLPAVPASRQPPQPVEAAFRAARETRVELRPNA